MNLSDFEGQWHLSRQIDDQTGLGVGLMQGSAVFHRDPDGLRYEEDGQLSFASQPPMRAQRTYLWQPDGQGVRVLFADGRAFHHIDLSHLQPQAAHWCDPDQYDVSYDFSDWPDWTSEWSVKGPRKDYRMRTVYHRPHHT